METVKAHLCAALLALSLAPLSAAPSSALVQGYEAYQSGDWSGAALFLRRAQSEPGGDTPDTGYMLITCSMYAGDYAAALGDCTAFLDRYADSPLAPAVLYQKGRALHGLGQNDRAVLVLSDFCHENPSSPLYASALFWLGECFYDDYNYETAAMLYSRVMDEFPRDGKAQEAADRLEAIARTEREQKLLYLLKMTGEEYLVSRENYERQLRQYQTEDMIALRRQLNAANARIAELEQAAAESVAGSQGGAAAAEGTEEAAPAEREDLSGALQSLKEKAELLQRILDGQSKQ